MEANDKPISLSVLESERLPFLPLDLEFWGQLPSLPGIYIFEDAKGKPLYIGKSISLRSRIKQHYEGYLTNTTKAANFIPQTKSIFIERVQSDIEAVILEANLIKSFQPKYNSAVKDGKSNVYIVFTDSPDTKFKITHSTDIREINLDNYKKQVFGPYTSVKTAETLLKICRSIFGFCNRPLNPNQTACFNYHLGLCPGPCVGKISAASYRTHLGKIKKFLSGKFKFLEKRLGIQIRQAAQKQNFEKAIVLRGQLFSLSHVLTSQNSSLLLSLSDANDQLLPEIVRVVQHPLLKNPPRRIECYDLAHHMGKQYVGSMVVFENCRANTAEYRHFNVDLPDQSDPHAMKQIISRRFHHAEWGTPDLIILDGGVPQLSIASTVVPNNIPVIALAKKRETIYFYSQENKIVSLSLPLDNPVLNLFRSVRDEAHRFANSFHRRKKEKQLIYT